MENIEMNSPEVSIVVPFFNEELMADLAIRKIIEVMINVDRTYEIIAVDDGSTDATVDILRDLKNEFDTLRLICFYRNWGHMAALSEGLMKAKGQIVISLDGDLQDPPKYIAQLLSEYDNRLLSDKPIEVVQTVRSDRTTDTFFKRTTAHLYYKIIKKLTGVEVIPHAADFRLLSRKAVDLINSMNPSMKIFRILIPYLGLKTSVVNIRRETRSAGKSKYKLRDMVKLAAESFLSFSSTPLRIFGITSLLISVVLLFLAFLFLLLWANGLAIPGWTSIVLLVSAANCFLFAILGLLGEFIGRTYESTQNRDTGKVSFEI
jgi:glycosyltransferase involved in cell wall biosynthesis